MDKYKTVDDFMHGLDDSRRLQVQKLRQYILDEVPSLVEHIKWNAPSYVEDGDDRITFNTMNKERVVKLVFHMGATRKEDKKGQPILKDASLLEWVSDIRGYMTFNSLEEITSNEEEIKRTVCEWLALT
ncbi:MAG TPA: DUF1801 domain-containing protein [Candidatus Saccharimonadales bacterium]|nr:DUF1801 domain-containing protein [Candidatus Saccharimonadales bacterium]